MKTKYTIKIWHCHMVIEEKTFTNKKIAKDWLRKSGWITSSENGDCYIQVSINDINLSTIELCDWY